MSGFKRQLISLVFGVIFLGIFKVVEKFGVTVRVTEFPSERTCFHHGEKRVGAEDLTKIRENIIIGGSNDNISMWDTPGGKSNTAKGYMFVYYPDQNLSKVLDIEQLPENFEFHPHGIYFEPETDRLYVLNHPYEGLGDRIEVLQLFIQQDGNVSARFISSLQLPEELNGTANDIIKISNNGFFVTQWIAYPDELTNSSRANLAGILRKAKNFLMVILQQKKTNVFHCRSAKNLEQSQNLACTVIQETSANMNNGITWNGKNQVLIADTTERQVRVFELDYEKPHDQMLTKIGVLRTTGLPDNVEYDRYLNQYTTGGYVSAYQYFLYVKAQAKNLPNYDKNIYGNWYFGDIIKPIEDKYKLENIYLRPDGIQGVSSFIQHKDSMIVGSFGDYSFGVCEIKGVNQKSPTYPSLFNIIMDSIKSLLGKK